MKKNSVICLKNNILPFPGKLKIMRRHSKPEDMSRLKAQLAEMKEIEQDLRRLSIVIRDSNDAITMQDLEGNILAWNRGAEKIYGYSEIEALNMNISHLTPEEKFNELSKFMKKLKEGEIVQSFETKRLTKDGKSLDIWLTVTPVPDERGDISIIATTERDVTEKNQLIRELAALSLKDDLTGLYNRRGFNVFGEKLLQMANRREGKARLLYMDMDNLKTINDNLGHAKGDEAIKSLADILRWTFRETDVVARMGGDEFAVLTEVGNDNKSLENTVKRLLDNIEKTNKQKGDNRLSVSIGTILSDGKMKDLETMLHEADQKMYQEKRQKHGGQKSVFKS